MGFVCTDGVISLAEVSLLSDFNERNEYAWSFSTFK